MKVENLREDVRSLYDRKDLARNSKEHVGVFGFLDSKWSVYNAIRCNPDFIMGSTRLLEIIMQDRYYYDKFKPSELVELYAENGRGFNPGLCGEVGTLTMYVPIPVFIHPVNASFVHEIANQGFCDSDFIYAYPRKPHGMLHEQLRLQPSN